MTSYFRSTILAGLLTLTAGASLAQSDLGEKEDPRLDKPITLTLQRASLEEVAAELTRQTGVTFRTSKETAWEPALVYVTAKPVRQVMTRLARLFDFTWSRSGKPGRYSYLLIQERKSAQQEEALRQRDWQLALDDLLRDLAKQPQGESIDPAERLFVNRLLSQMDTQQTLALTSGRTVKFSTFADGKSKTLPGPLRNELLRLHREMCEKNERQGNAAPTPPGLQETFAALKGLRLSVWMDPRTGPDAVQASLTARSYGVFPPGSDRLLDPFGPYVGGGVYRFPIPASPAPDEATAKWGGDPLLSQKRSFKVAPLKTRAVAMRKRTQRRLYEILPAIARTYGADIVADAYRDQRTPPQPTDEAEDLKLYEVLNRYAYPCSEWNKTGSIIEVRSRGWHFDRLPDVPDRFIVEWAEKLRKQRRMTLDETAPLLATLRDQQLLNLGDRLREEGVDIGGGGFYLEMMRGGKEILRAYLSLTQDQRVALKAGERLSPVNMPPAAREWLSRAGEQAARVGFSPEDLNPLPAGLLSLRVDRIEKTFDPPDGEHIRFRWKNLDGGVFSGNGASERSSTPPAHLEPGQITQHVTFKFEIDEKQIAYFPMHLPWVFAEPLPLPEGVP